MIALTLMAMFAFVFLDGLMRGSAPTQAGGGEIVVESSVGNLNQADLRQLTYRRQRANDFIRTALFKVHPEFQNYPEQFLSMQIGGQMFGFNRASLEEDVVLGHLLRHEARRLRIVVDDARIQDFILGLTNQKLSSEQFRKIVSDMRMSSKELYDVLRDELLARMALELVAPRDPQPPERLWKFYQQLHVRQKIEAAAVPVSEFVSQVKEPSEGDVVALFEANKKEFDQIENGALKPGFRQPHKVKLHYLHVRYQDVEASVLKKNPVKPADVEAFYEANKDKLYRFNPIPEIDPKTQPLIPEFTPDPLKPDPLKAPGPAPAEKPPAEKPGDDKPAPDKPATDKPAPDKPAPDKPAPDKPADAKPEADKPAPKPTASDNTPADKPGEGKPPAGDKPAKDAPSDEPAPGKDPAKPEAKPEPKPEPKPEAKPEAKPEPPKDADAPEEEPSEDKKQSRTAATARIKLASAAGSERLIAALLVSDAGDAKAADAPSEDTPKDDAPKEKATEKPGDAEKPSEKPEPDTPKNDPSGEDAPKKDTPKADVPKPDAGKPEPPKPDAGKPESGKPESGKPEPKDEKPETPDPKKPAEPAKPAPAAEKPAPAAEEKPAEKSPAPAGAKGDPADAPPPPQFKPLDEELRGQIRDELLRERTLQAMRDLGTKAENAMSDVGIELNAGFEDLQAPTAEDARKASEASRAALKKIGGELRMKFLETDLVSPRELSELPGIGRAREPSEADSFRTDAPTLVSQMFSSSNLLMPFQAQDGDDWYVAWKVQDVQAHVPELTDPGVRDQVVRAWKLMQAEPLARARAEELAKLAAKSAKPLRETLAKQTVTGAKGSVPVSARETPEFTWMRESSTPSMNPFGPRPPPQISEPVFIEKAGNAFMEVVFDQLAKPNDVGVAPNGDKSIFYVVKLLERTPATRESFLKTPLFGQGGFFATPYEQLARQEQGTLINAFDQRLETRYHVKWNELSAESGRRE